MTASSRRRSRAGICSGSTLWVKARLEALLSPRTHEPRRRGFLYDHRALGYDLAKQCRDLLLEHGHGQIISTITGLEHNFESGRERVTMRVRSATVPLAMLRSTPGGAP